MARASRYLRIVATTRCNYHCGFCHMEGDRHAPGSASELSADRLIPCLKTAVLAGVEKFKFLGGEAFLRADLPVLIHSIREASPGADISVISAGAVPVERLRAAYDAGLSRVNVSIHGFGHAAFQRNNRARGAFELRARFLDEALVQAERRRVPLKLNYVFGQQVDPADLNALLDWAALRPVVVNVLDDLSQDLSWRELGSVLSDLRGPHTNERLEPDPNSLPTLHRLWSDGLRVELKHQQLGQIAPFSSCNQCPARARCKEGILALRLTHRGELQPCMDRPDLSLELASLAATNGPRVAALLWKTFAESL